MVILSRSHSLWQIPNNLLWQIHKCHSQFGNIKTELVSEMNITHSIKNNDITKITLVLWRCALINSCMCILPYPPPPPFKMAEIWVDHQKLSNTLFVSFCFSSKTTATFCDVLFDIWCFGSYFVTFYFKLIVTNHFCLYLMLFCFVRASQNNDSNPWFHNIVLHGTVYKKQKFQN